MAYKSTYSNSKKLLLLIALFGSQAAFADFKLYSFAELDTIYDTTQSFTDLAGNTPVTPSDDGKMIFSARNSRIGFRFSAPDFHKIKTSAVAEMDFRGNQPAGISELAFFTNPTFRIRHAYFKIETPVVDIVLGQTWGLFGWQALYHPNTVQYQGLPAQVFSRTPQIKLSKTLKFSDVSLEMAIAMMRPPEANSGTPDGQAGLRIALDSWTGMHTIGIAGTGLQSLSLALSGTIRKFSLLEFLHNLSHRHGEELITALHLQTQRISALETAVFNSLRSTSFSKS
ncbi:MAG: hypothetical protein WCK49_01065 [Myxococcaceae bacterium]